MIFVNFKTYKESSGERAVQLVHLIEEVAAQTAIPLIPVVSAIELAQIAPTTRLPLWVQHTDPAGYGAHTGSILPQEVHTLGGVGTFLNHSEHKLDHTILSESVVSASSAGLQTLVFAAHVTELQEVIMMKPNFVSYEPPELVGSTTTSVSTAKPEVIKEAAVLAASAQIPLIVGAGIHSAEDVKVALSLGAQGVAVATNIVKAADPKGALLQLLEGFV